MRKEEGQSEKRWRDRVRGEIEEAREVNETVRKETRDRGGRQSEMRGRGERQSERRVNK